MHGIVSANSYSHDVLELTGEVLVLDYINVSHITEWLGNISCLPTAWLEPFSSLSRKVALGYLNNCTCISVIRIATDERKRLPTYVRTCHVFLL